MTQLYLSSSIESSGPHIAQQINLQGLTLKALKAAFIYTAGEPKKTWAAVT